MNRRLPLPTTIDAISCEWLSEALRTFDPEISLTGFEIIDINRGTCTKIRLRLHVAGQGDRRLPKHVILKGGFEPHSRDLHYILEKEARAYSELLPELGLRHPDIYFAAYEAEAAQGIIIMEDLVERGVSFCDPLIPHSYDAVAARLSELARFHAKSWESAELSSGGKWDWVDDVGANQLRYFGQFLQEDVWARFIRTSRGAAASVRFHDVDWMREALGKVAQLAGSMPHCVVHCDTHLGNLYVDVDGTPGFFDPLGGHAPAMLEVTYHIGCALDPADRPHWERRLIAHYLAELSASGVKAPPLDEALRHYAAFLAFGYCVFIINDAVFQPEAVNTAYTARFSAAMLDNDTIGTLQQF